VSNINASIRTHISGVLRKDDTLVVFVDALPEHSILMSRLSASQVEYIELHDEEGSYASGRLLRDSLKGENVVWDTSKRQLLVIGDIQNIGVTHLCLGAVDAEMETFFYPIGDFMDFQTELSIQRLVRAGASPISLTHLVSELSTVYK